jgi:hypothetical protein
MAMNGMCCGVRKRKLTGFFKNIGLYLKLRLITFVDGTNYAERIC